MKVLFLDIDGVLNRIGTRNRTSTRWNGFIGMEPELVARCNRLVEETGAQVVLSSVWRLHDSWRETMKANGLTFEFLDRTPKHEERFRGHEVALWLTKQPEVERYAIVDDDNDFYISQPLVQTSYHDGLTEQMARRIAALLHDNVGAPA
jgi:HAD domain in Swiss Army Knife RNA repair proteins